MAKDPFIRKLNLINHAYGSNAVQYFKDTPYCEHCREERIVVLNVHHIDGKNVDNFKILCHNCHMIEHNPKIANETFATYTLRLYSTNKAKLSKAENILKRLNENMPIRDIITIEHTSMPTIQKVMMANGFVSENRKGYLKI